MLRLILLLMWLLLLLSTSVKFKGEKKEKSSTFFVKSHSGKSSRELRFPCMNPEDSWVNLLRIEISVPQSKFQIRSNLLPGQQPLEPKPAESQAESGFKPPSFVNSFPNISVSF